MTQQGLFSYIAGLPVGTVDWAREAEAETEAVSAVDVDHLPDGLVTGSNLMQFEGELDPHVRSAVALSLLAAQRVAANDTVIRSPDEWIERHNTVLKNLNWLIDGGAVTDAKFDDVNVAVHEAIIPFLTTALGPAAAAATMIKAALEQLQAMDKDTPWITLFDRESRRFDVSEYQFSYVDTDGDDTVLRMAAARLDAKFGRTQVLFFKIREQKAKFKAASSTLRAQTALLEQMNEALKLKLGAQTNAFIRELDIGA
jgi:hypothetical protein